MAAGEVGRQHLVAMDVAREHRRELRQDVGCAHHVVGRSERVVRWPDGSAFDAVMQAQQAMRCRGVATAGLCEKLRKAAAHVAAFVRKPGKRDRLIAHLHAERARAIEDVDLRVHGETCVRQARAFVIAGDDEDRDAALRNPTQRLECLIRHGRYHRWPIEHVACVHDEIHVTRECGLEGAGVVREKVVAATPALDTRAGWEVEAKVRVGQQQILIASGIGLRYNERRVACNAGCYFGVLRNLRVCTWICWITEGWPHSPSTSGSRRHHIAAVVSGTRMKGETSRKVV